MRDCIECGTPTEGSIGAAGLRWNMLCQPCKDKADIALQGSIAAIAAAHDYVMPRVNKVFAMATLDHGAQQPSPTTPEAA